MTNPAPVLPIDILIQALAAVSPSNYRGISDNINEAVQLTVGGEPVDLTFFAVVFCSVAGVDSLSTELAHQRDLVESLRQTSMSTREELATQRSLNITTNNEREQYKAEVEALRRQLAEAQLEPVSPEYTTVSMVPKDTIPSKLGNAVVCGVDKWNQLAATSNAAILGLLNIQARLLAAVPEETQSELIASALLAADTIMGKIHGSVLPAIDVGTTGVTVSAPAQEET